MDRSRRGLASQKHHEVGPRFGITYYKRSCRSLTNALDAVTGGTADEVFEFERSDGGEELWHCALGVDGQ